MKFAPTQDSVSCNNRSTNVLPLESIPWWETFSCTCFNYVKAFFNSLRLGTTQLNVARATGNGGKSRFGLIVYQHVCVGSKLGKLFVFLAFGSDSGCLAWQWKRQKPTTNKALSTVCLVPPTPLHDDNRISFSFATWKYLPIIAHTKRMNEEPRKRGTQVYSAFFLLPVISERLGEQDTNSNTTASAYCLLSKEIRRLSGICRQKTSRLIRSIYRD
jgi:hypothetical protein